MLALFPEILFGDTLYALCNIYKVFNDCKDIFDEPFGHGWGIDLPGFESTLKFVNIQAHTLKPATSGNSDGHMIHDNGRIKFTQDGKGRCLTAKHNMTLSFLNADICEDDNHLQLWDISVSSYNIHSNSNLAVLIDIDNWF